jgi:hypothetical protein
VKKFMQNFGEETYLKLATSMPRMRCKDNIKNGSSGDTLRGRKVDGTGPRLCPVAGFGISGVESWGSATTVLVRWILGR